MNGLPLRSVAYRRAACYATLRFVLQCWSERNRRGTRTGEPNAPSRGSWPSSPHSPLLFPPNGAATSTFTTFVTASGSPPSARQGSNHRTGSTLYGTPCRHLVARVVCNLSVLRPRTGVCLDNALSREDDLGADSAEITRSCQTSLSTTSSDSTLRFREHEEVETALVEHAYVVDDVREAPDRPGRPSTTTTRVANLAKWQVPRAETSFGA